MPRFVNAAQFEKSQNHQRASGASQTIVDPQGTVIGHVQTGGMIGPARKELYEGTVLFRFGGAGDVLARVAAGSWWLERDQFERLVNFANVHGLAVTMAARILCLVPPEWSDMGTLVRARATRPLLAYRGLGNNVVVPKTDGLGAVRLPHQNEIASRRIYQLFIPGLAEQPTPALQIEHDWRMDVAAATQGWLYLP